MTRWVQISSGRGPAECCWVVARVAERLIEEAKEAALKVQFLESVPGPEPGTFKSVLLVIEGEGAPAIENRWTGTVQWIGTSPFRPHHKRRNWYVGIEPVSFPEIPPGSAQDIKVETMRSSGPGGQHVNKTETAVRATHIPTGLSAIAQEERSQHLNRNLALARLRVLVERENARIQGQAQKERWDVHNAIERGNPVRVFEGLEFRNSSSRTKCSVSQDR